DAPSQTSAARRWPPSTGLRPRGATAAAAPGSAAGCAAPRRRSSSSQTRRPGCGRAPGAGAHPVPAPGRHPAMPWPGRAACLPSARPPRTGRSGAPSGRRRLMLPGPFAVGGPPGLRALLEISPRELAGAFGLELVVEGLGIMVVDEDEERAVVQIVEGLKDQW